MKMLKDSVLYYAIGCQENQLNGANALFTRFGKMIIFM